MNQKEWDKWKELPATVDFFQYLEDTRGKSGRDIAEAITGGFPVTQEHTDKIAMECAVILEIGELEYEDIEDHYKSEIEEILEEEAA